MADNLLTDKEHDVLAYAIVKAMNKDLPANTWRLAEHETWAEIKGPEGQAFSLHFEGYGNQGKLRVTGTFPRTNDGEYIGIPRGTSDPEIGVSLSRGAETIAKEITRRFLPEYLPILAMVQKTKQERDLIAAMVASNTAALAAAFEEPLSKNETTRKETLKNGHLHVGSHRCFYGEARISTTTVNLTLGSIPLATAHKIAALLMELPKDKA